MISNIIPLVIAYIIGVFLLTALKVVIGSKMSVLKYCLTILIWSVYVALEVLASPFVALFGFYIIYLIFFQK